METNVRSVQTNMAKTRSVTRAEQDAKPELRRKCFSTVKRNNSGNGGIVVMGCEGDIEVWRDDILEDLKEEKIAITKDFATPYYVVTKNGRIDLVFPLRKITKANIGALVIWRCLFGGCQWIRDYISGRYFYRSLSLDHLN